MVTWSLPSAVATGPTSFHVLRLLLRAADAGFSPGVILFVTYWVPRPCRGQVLGLLFGVPVAGTGKVLAIRLNYADHAAEPTLPIPEEPVVFTKAISSLTGPNDRVMLPRDSEKGDWEVELGIVIGSRASDVEQADALEHVAACSTVDDVSEHESRIARGGTWDEGKACDAFGPAGPWLVTRDDMPDPQALGLWLDVDGAPMRTGNTKTMIFGVAEIVSYLSRLITLTPGDIVTTGTPRGSAWA